MKRLKLLFFILCCCSCSKQEKQIKDHKKEINSQYELATAYNKNGQVDSAFYYFFKAKDLAIIQNDSLVIGKCLVNLAIISTNKRDDLNGQELSFNALSYLNEKNKDHHLYLSYNYNNLGKACQNLRTYNEAIKYYDLAIKFSKDQKKINLYLNNKAYLYQETKQYQKALKIYTQLQKSTHKSDPEYERILSNTSFTKWLLNSKYNALPELLIALHLREKQQDLWGQNASYYYLSEYYEKVKPDSALFYAHKMYKVAKELNSSDDQLYALQKLTRLSAPQLKNHFFEQYLKIDDSALVIRNADKHQFALIRYRSKKNEEENFKLQKDNTEKKYQIIKREILFVITFLILIAGSIIAILWYKKRKQKLALETASTIKENQLKTSKKVHDVVANGLYRVMTEIENQQEIDKENLLDKIEDMYEKSRDISYEKPQPNDFDFHEKIDHLILSFTSANIEIKVTGNTGSLWKKCNKKTQDEVEHIIQELMVNMKKHSQATQVEISFQQSGTQVSINYKDNGIGMPKGILFKNGLSNTGNRIKSIYGDITFDQQHKKGLAIHISFPFS